MNKCFLLLAIVLIGISGLKSYSATYHDLVTKSDNNRLLPSYEPGIAYSIYIPGKEIEKGKFTPASIIKMKKLDKKYYMPSKIHIKTKSRFYIDKNDKGIPSASIQ